MKHSFRTIIVAFTLFALLIAPNLGNSQEFNFPASKDPAVFKAQLLQFVQLTRKNLLEIQALPVDDSSPVDQSLINSAHTAYALIRSALHGMELALDQQTYKDPALILAKKRVEQAWNLARFPAQSQSVPTRAEWVSRSVQNLTQALRLVQQAQAILP